MTLLEIESAVNALAVEEKRHLLQYLLTQLDQMPVALKEQERLSVLDIPTYSLGECLMPLTRDDDLLGEMLEDRL